MWVLVPCPKGDMGTTGALSCPTGSCQREGAVPQLSPDAHSCGLILTHVPNWLASCIFSDETNDDPHPHRRRLAAEDTALPRPGCSARALLWATSPGTFTPL